MHVIPTHAVDDLPARFFSFTFLAAPTQILMSTQSVRAWTFTNKYGSLKLSRLDVPKAESIKEPQILLKVHACAANPVDVQHMNLPNWSSPDAQHEKGTVRDFSGTVLAGGRSQGLEEGDEVFGMSMDLAHGGVLAEQAVLPERSLAIKKPSGWTHRQAAAVPLVWLTARTCIEDVSSVIEKTSSKRLVVLGGSSSTGIYTVLLAKKRGWTVCATSSGKNKDFVLNDLQADAHVDYTSQNVREEVTNFKPDAVIDCVGGTVCIGVPGNRRYITIVGDKTGRTTMGGPYTYNDWSSPVNAASQWIRWAKGEVGFGETYDVAVLRLKREWLEEAASDLTANDIYIDSTFKFESAHEAFERLNTGRAKGKVVIEVVG